MSAPTTVQSNTINCDYKKYIAIGLGLAALIAAVALIAINQSSESHNNTNLQDFSGNTNGEMNQNDVDGLICLILGLSLSIIACCCSRAEGR